ncbi:uncharacterized protein LOC135714762 [Ochlerotatus camptorhynchus]|uniref:uncharacterized protein LOC135714762 n=1 Tax=Ochlerotatus camptorhynchus TaxID=644619 RepID=UPI0031DB2AB2
MGAVSQLFATGTIGGAADKEISATDADVVTKTKSLTIVTNAEREAKGSTVTGARRNAAAVKGVPPLPSSQVNFDVANLKKAQTKGAKPKMHTGTHVVDIPVRSMNAVVYAKPNARYDPNLNVRVTRFSHCELCNERDNSRMVQCDGCDTWYHFSCVEVSRDIANYSWMCPQCHPHMYFDASSLVQQRPILQQIHPVDPPPNVMRSTKSIGKASSNRSKQRKVDRLLQKLEEQKQLEQRFLDEKYRIIDEEDDDDDGTVVSDDDVGSEEISKVRGWLRDTEKCGEDYDSGLVEEDMYDDQPQRVVRQAPIGEQAEPRSTLQGFVPNQRSTPREPAQVDSRSRSRIQEPPVTADMFRRPPAHYPMDPFRKPLPAVISDNQHRQPPAPIPELHIRPPLPPAFENQFYQPQIHRSTTDLGGNQAQQPQAHWKATHNYRPQDSRQFSASGVQFHPSLQASQAAPVPRVQGSRQIPTAANGQFWSEPTFVPENQYTQTSASRSRILQGDTPFQNSHYPEPDPRDVEANVCILSRNQVVARQAVSKDLPEFYGNPEDWPLFFSMYASSTQMCGFSNEENMLRLRKCLKGKALEAVRCRLLHPSNVSSVISTLKMLYGRPEAIVQASIRKIRSLPSPQVEKLDTLVNFALTVENLVATIEACGVEDFIYNAALKVELVERLPPGLKLDWAKYSRNNPAPNLLHFSQWLYSIAEDASAVMPIASNTQRSRGTKNDGFINVHSDAEPERSRSMPAKTRAVQGSSLVPITKCATCKGSCTTVAKCKRFAELSLDAKWAVVREAKLCRKCLRKHNGSCRQQKPCGIKGCTFLHHPLLHNEKQEAPATGSCNVHQAQTSEVLFRIVPVLLHGPSKVVRTYAFIDDGSELTLMEDSLAEELGVKGPRSPLCLKWTGGTKRVENASQKVEVQISAIGNTSKPHRMSNVHTIQNLQLRPQTLVYSELLQRFQHLGGLPVESYSNICPRILIGLDHTSLGHAMKSREGKPYEPIAVKTRLGWIVYGSCSRTQQQPSYVNVHTIKVCECNLESDENLHAAMKNYFTLDSLGVVKPEKVLRSTEDQRAMEMLEKLTIPKEGRYESGLLWKYDNVRFPCSKGMAFRRWQCLDRRMQRDKEFSETVMVKMSEYVAKGYVRKLTEDELNAHRSQEWYLPVFPVVNPNKPSKVRLVWDAAAPAYGVSLNSLLLKGPDLLTSLLAVLVQFREFRIAICGDIREMYLQVLLKQDVRLCFFWKDNQVNADPSVYIMTVLPFGVSCAPSIAQYVKNTNAQRFEKDHPTAVRAIVDQHYVDDMLASVESEQEAIDLARNVKKIHAEAGFEMRSWISNSPAVLEALHERTTEGKDLNMGEGLTTEKVLGMWWNTATDCFTFKISPRYDPELMSGHRKPTKREVLRTLMMIFDPLGLIGHFLMFLKVVLQEIWRTSVGWDDPIEEAQFELWIQWLKVLPEVAKVEIPRCYRTTTSAGYTNEVQMHTFVDASEKGFAAVVYLRYKEGLTIETALVGSKTRVAPIKFLSIPRSELQASVIGVRLANSIEQSLSIKVNRRFFWTDSSDVISWLKSDHRRYSQFVAFRVSEILEASEVSEWQWIQTMKNVADDGTKWKRAPDMSRTSRWFNGPEFLKTPEGEWPMKLHIDSTTMEELRPHLLVHVKQPEPIIDPQNYSKWTPLLRRTAYVFRFIRNVSTTKPEERTAGPLTNSELTMAENYLFRCAQCSAYADEIAMLLDIRASKHSTKTIPRSSPIYHLCPFLDEHDVLRVRGRTSACPFVQQDTVNPIILPRDHQITHLIISHYHSKYHHQNHNTVINELRQRYSIPRLKAAYNSIRRCCQQCKHDRAQPQPPVMSDLPLPRLAAYARPFTYMGVDYFGPFMIILGRRLEKRWVLLATCLTTRAIHLQIVHTMTTDSCIMALRNVMARRGVPAVIYSDRGTNFQGASKELEEAMANLDRERLAVEFTSSHTSWNFIPPASPHMGGAWERLIRTVKQNLGKLKANRMLSHEVLENMLLEVENIVNSRPLTSIPLDDDQSPVLTPNHFLMGSSNGLRPWVPFDDSSEVLKNCWELSQALANQFWKQWLRDYLPSITRRTKWYTEVKPIKINDIVVIVDPKLPRNTWPKGRVIGIKQGSDGQVRSATVQTSGGIYERPTVKLAVLDVGVGSNAHHDDQKRITGGSVDCATSTSPPSPTRPEKLT